VRPAGQNGTRADEERPGVLGLNSQITKGAQDAMGDIADFFECMAK
jgi:hypothetical protein